MCGSIKTLLHIGYRGLAEALAPDDIELTGRAAHPGIDGIALACHRYRSATVIELGQSEFGLDDIVEVACAESLSRLCMLAVDIARLNHEVADDAMEEQRVVDMHLDQLHEIIPMLGCLVV